MTILLNKDFFYMEVSQYVAKDDKASSYNKTHGMTRTYIELVRTIGESFSRGTLNVFMVHGASLQTLVSRVITALRQPRHHDVICM